MSQSGQTPKLDSELSRRVAAYDQPGGDPEESWIKALCEAFEEATAQKNCQTAALTATTMRADDSQQVQQRPSTAVQKPTRSAKVRDHEWTTGEPGPRPLPVDTPKSLDGGISSAVDCTGRPLWRRSRV
jgi:hypothetical protein